MHGIRRGWRNARGLLSHDQGTDRERTMAHSSKVSRVNGEIVVRKGLVKSPSPAGRVSGPWVRVVGARRQDET